MDCCKHLLLDLFCGGGGCSKGYQQAGFRVVGVDIEEQPNYIGDDFVRGDALNYLAMYGRRFAAVHASPPCQAHSRCKRIGNAAPGHRDFLPETRRLLVVNHRPWVIENVEGSALRQPITLCGTMFGLPLRRHRLFEANFLLHAPASLCSHGATDLGVYAGKVTRLGSRAAAYLDAQGRTHWRPQTASLEEGRLAMGTPWMDRLEMSQAVPPAYCKFVGEQLYVFVGSKTVLVEGVVHDAAL